MIATTVYNQFSQTCTHAVFALFLSSFWKLARYHGFQRCDSFKGQHWLFQSYRDFIYCLIWFKFSIYIYLQRILDCMIKLSYPIIGSRVTAPEWAKKNTNDILFLV